MTTDTTVDSTFYTWWLLLVIVTDLTIRIAAIIIVPRNRRPAAATAWLLAIYFIPAIGVILFLLIGNPRLPRTRRKKQQPSLLAARAAQASFAGSPRMGARSGSRRRPAV